MILAKILLPYAFIAIFSITGYVKNIIKLSDCDFKPSYKAEVIHGIGIFPIVGVFTGYMDFGK